jgi:glutamyl-tRNA synthetase
MKNSSEKIRVRFAPSPTGYLHIGSLRTVLYDYLFAKNKGGTFLLRIEDTDRKRYIEGSVKKLIETLKWVGISWDEGVYEKSQISNLVFSKTTESKTYPGVFEYGDFGPYVQSERLATYKKYAEQLVAEGKAYYCFCEPERLEKMREKQVAEKKAPSYDRYCLTNILPEQINKKLQENCPSVIRLKVPKDELIEFDDIIYGKISVSSNTIDDQVLIKSDGFPTYHLASVVDDYLMKITHVTRGEEWLPSTPKHILLYRAFGWKEPKFGHMPLLINTEKKKLSKRHSDVAIEDYIEKGYLKDALINFIVLLGWNPGAGSTQEIFSMEELIEKFDLSHVHKAGAVFDLKKLDWLNSQYIKKLSIEDLLSYAKPYLEKKDFFIKANDAKKNDEYLEKFLKVEQERLIKFSDIGEESKFFFENILPKKEMLKWKNMSDIELAESLEKSKKVLSEIVENDWTLENIEKNLLLAAGEKRGDLLWPLRVSLTAAQKSPSPFEVAWVLGKEETIKRVEKSLSI